MVEDGSKSHLHVLEVPSTPDERHFIVNFPGYVGNEDRALATFGDIEGVAAQRAEHPKYLQLWLRRDDPYSHPIASDDARPTPTLVLKISRPRNGASTSSGSETVQVVSTSECTYSFTSPADFQYVGRDTRPQSSQWSDLASTHADDGPEGLPCQPLLCSPPSFSVEGTTDYSFKQYKAADHGIDSLGRKPKRASNVTSIDYFVSEVPEALMQPPEMRLALQPMAQRLNELLAQRPVYLDAALTHALGALSRSMGGGQGGGGDDANDRDRDANTDGNAHNGFSGSKGQQEVLSKLCYRFKNGPWKGAWVQRGYDPRQHSDARQYQVLDYTLPSDWYRKLSRQRQERAAALDNGVSTSNATAVGPLAAPPLAKSYGELCAFLAVASTSSTPLQLCDLEDDRVAEALNDAANVDGACNDASGWFCQPAWEGLKARVSARFQSLLDASAAAAEAAASSRPQPMAIDNNNNIGTIKGGGGASGSGAAAAGAATVADILPPGLMAQLMHMLGSSKAGGAGASAAAGPEVSLPAERVPVREEAQNVLEESEEEEEEEEVSSDGGGGSAAEEEDEEGETEEDEED